MLLKNSFLLKGKTLIAFLLFWLICQPVYAQKILDIVLISDAAPNEAHFLESKIKSEIEQLLGSSYKIRFEEVFTSRDVNQIQTSINSVFDKKKADALIGAGLLSSYILSKQASFPIPSISSVQIGHINGDNSNQGSSSGISNYTFVKSPFEVELGLQTIREICGCEKVALLLDPSLADMQTNLRSVFSETIISDIETHILEKDLASTVSKISQDVGGVYILSPLYNYSPSDISNFFNRLADLKHPTFSLLDKPMLELGAYAAFSVSENIQKIPRRIALHIEKIVDGKDPKDFSVDIEAFTHQIVFNMETVNKIGIYPKWSLLDDALLMNINKRSSDRVINLKSIIAEALENNVGYKIESKQTELSKKDVSLANSNYMPQIAVQSAGVFLDENSVDGSFGTKGSFNWTAGASFSQLILSEPAIANITIQKLLLESQKQEQAKSELDVVQETAQRYFSYLQIQSVAELYNSNINAINQNLNIASNKEKVGYSGASDVYRWTTELNLAKTDYNSANAQLKSVGYQINESLNRPINEKFVIDDLESIQQLIEQLDKTFLSLIENQSALELFADFLANEAKRNLPEMQQMNLAISAQERALKSSKRAFFIPRIAVGVNYDYTIDIVNPGSPPPITGFETNTDPRWNAGINVSIPLFSGASRKFQLDRNKVGLLQLKDRQVEISNLLELQVRANLERVNASYNNIRLTRNAADGAEKNIEIVQNLYKEGQVNVTTLVDAQNALLGAQINATNSVYQFMIDFFNLQRSMGNYLILNTEEQRLTFIQRFLNFKKD